MVLLYDILRASTLSAARSIVQWQSTILVSSDGISQIHHRHGLEHFKVRLCSRRGIMGGDNLTAALKVIPMISSNFMKSATEHLPPSNTAVQWRELLFFLQSTTTLR
jgi:hypothetical protein